MEILCGERLSRGNGIIISLGYSCERSIMKIWIKWFKHGKYSNCEGSKNHKINEKYVECVPHHLDDADNSGSQRSVEQQPSQGSQQSQGCCDGENSGSYVDSMIATVQCPVIY